MKHKYKKKIKIASSVALSAAMIVNSAGSLFAENEKQAQEYNLESHEEKIETIEESNEDVETTTQEDIPLTEEYFPDEAFREFVTKRFDKDSSGVLEKAELDAVTSIEIKNAYGVTVADKIKSFKGIEHFQNLTSFTSNTFSLKVEEVDFSKNPNLSSLTFSSTEVKVINVSGTQVRNLIVPGNKQLEVINLGENPVTSFGELNVSNTPKLREIIGFDKIEEFRVLDIRSYYYEKGHYKYGQHEVGVRGFDLSQKTITTVRISQAGVAEPMTLAWLHLGPIQGMLHINDNQNSIVEMDRKGTPIEESDTDLEFKLQDKFPGIDPSRAYVIQENGLTYDKTTGTVVRTTPEVKYHYDCGQRGNNTLMLEVTLRFNPYKDIFNPQTNRITVAKGSTTLPDAATTIANLADMPEDTTFAWRGSIDTSTVGEQTGSIQVTYPDGTKEKIDITVDVVDGDASDADRYTPVINTAGITTYKDETPSVEKIKEAITNADSLPENTVYAWKSLDVTTVGATTGIATVTYPDRSVDEVEIKVNVIDPTVGSNADIYEAETTQITLDQGVAPDNGQIEAGIVNKDALPAGTKYEWQEVDTVTPGEKEAKIKVVYPDGSADENVVMPVRVKHYNEMFNLEVNPAGITTTQGETPSVEKIKEAIANANTLPEGTTYSWKSLDVTTVGKTTGIVTVTYPDRSVDEVSIEVLVEEKEQGPGTGGDENKPLNPNEPTDPTLPEEPTQPEGSIEGVQTGDTTQVGLWAAIMGGSIGILAYLKRKKKNFHI